MSLRLRLLFFWRCSRIMGGVLKLKKPRKKKKLKAARKRRGHKNTTKPNQEPNKDYLIPKPINPQARDLICQDIRESGHQEQILKDFKKHLIYKLNQCVLKILHYLNTADFCAKLLKSIKMINDRRTGHKIRRRSHRATSITPKFLLQPQ